MHNKEDQFKDLYQTYMGMVHQLCLGFTKGDGHVAGDLTQETFIQVWRYLDKFRGAATHKTWIYRITVNTCLKAKRDEKLNDTIPINQLPSRDETEAKTENYQELYHAIGKLAELDRLIIMMVLDELDYQEIGKIVGITKGNLRVKIHRIKKKLKKILAND